MKQFIYYESDAAVNERSPAPPTFTERPTVKVIVEDSDGRIALVTSNSHSMWLLPGGGAETGDLKREAERECEEEISKDIEINDEVARSIEYRNRTGKKYVTTCFAAYVVGDSTGDSRTQSERDGSLEVRWFSRDGVLKIIETQRDELRAKPATPYNIFFNVARDGEFLRTYLENVGEFAADIL